MGTITKLAPRDEIAQRRAQAAMRALAIHLMATQAKARREIERTLSLPSPTSPKGERE